MLAAAGRGRLLSLSLILARWSLSPIFLPNLSRDPEFLLGEGSSTVPGFLLGTSRDPAILLGTSRDPAILLGFGVSTGAGGGTFVLLLVFLMKSSAMLEWKSSCEVSLTSGNEDGSWPPRNREVARPL